MQTKYFLNLLIFVFMLNLDAQNLTKAKKEYENLSYVKTAQKLLKLVEKGKTSSEILEKLANAYYFNNKMMDAEKWYAELIKLNKNVDAEILYRYAMSLKAVKKYQKSNIIFKQFSAIKPTDGRSRLFKSNPNYLAEIQNIKELYAVKNISSNTKYSDFGTSFYEDGIVFSSSRNTESSLYKWNEQPFLDLFYINKNEGKPIRLGGSVNTKYHESSTSFTKNGDTMYFTRNNYYKGKLRKSSKKINGLKLFKATKLANNNWGNIEALPFNSNNYNVAHPALSPDNTKLYFSSDMEGTKGASDIFVVDILPDGSYSSPRNLGAKVNTEGRENFPFVSNNNILYFSSDGHLGLGGLDVFKLDLNTPNSKVENLGKPINSSMDDFEFIIDDFKEKGYLTSNRPGGKGDDDIYGFEKISCNQMVSFTVVDAVTKSVISGANIVLFNADSKIIKSVSSDDKGMFSYPSNCIESNYVVQVTKENYSQAKTAFNQIGRDNINIKIELLPKPKIEVNTGGDLTKILNLNPIYFDLDKAIIRSEAKVELEKVISFMKSNPNVKIEVRSHTDSRASTNYNYKLSQRRNVATLNYIITHGIASERLTGNGYGETQLVNNCVNGVKCHEDEHQLNRRSEFIIIKK